MPRFRLLSFLVLFFAACATKSSSPPPPGPDPGPPKSWMVGAGGAMLSIGGSGEAVVRPSYVSTTLSALTCIDDFIGWAVGDDGTILYTNDGGKNWSPQFTGVAESLRGVHFSTHLRGVAVGDGGTLLFTVDGGEHWQKLGSAGSRSLRAVKLATNSSIGYAVGDGGLVLTTNDGGRTWAALASPTTENLWSVDTNDDGSQAVAVGSAGVMLSLRPDGAERLSNDLVHAGLHGVKLAGDGFVAVGERGAAVTVSLVSGEIKTLSTGTSEDLLSLFLHESSDPTHHIPGMIAAGMIAVGRHGTIVFAAKLDGAFETIVSGTSSDLLSVDDLTGG